MEMNHEFMTNAIDDTLEDNADEDETEESVSGVVLDEISISITNEVGFFTFYANMYHAVSNFVQYSHQ